MSVTYINGLTADAIEAKGIRVTHNTYYLLQKYFYGILETIEDKNLSISQNFRKWVVATPAEELRLIIILGALSE
jgi:hypothetical protein